MKESNAALDKTERKESFFEQMQSTKRVRKPLNVFPAIVEWILTSRGDRKGFAIEKSADFIDSDLLWIISQKNITIIA